jgi:hypothetical protein
MVSMPFPQISESDASPDLVAIYEDIRQVIGIPLVNLIYRHFATLPGVLPWAWNLVRPPIAAGLVELEREQLINNVMIGLRYGQNHRTGLPRHQLRPPAIREIRQLIDIYNRGNTTNLIVLTAVRLHLQQVRGMTTLRSSSEFRPRSMSLATIRIPALPKLADLSPQTRALVQTLNAAHNSLDDGITPSLYLHLAHWPPFLTVAQDLLQPLFARNELQKKRDATIQMAETSASRLLTDLGAPEPLPAEHAGTVCLALNRFTRHIIPELIAVGFVLSSALSTD